MNIDRFEARRYGYSNKKFYTWLAFTIIMLLCTVGVLFIFTSIKRSVVEDLAAYEERLVREVSVLERLQKERQKLGEVNKESQRKLAKIETLTAIDRNTPYNFLLALADVVPDSIVLTSFSFNAKDIELKGLAGSVHGVTFLMRELAHSNVFKNPKIISMNRDGKDVVFVIQVLKA